jgi:hypothetical protein
MPVEISGIRLTVDDRRLCLLDGVIRTQDALFRAGLGEVVEKWARGLEL